MNYLIPILANRPPSCPQGVGQLSSALPMLECMIPLRAGAEETAIAPSPKSQRFHLSGERGAFAELSDHHDGPKDYQVLPVAQTAGDSTASVITPISGSASSGQPQPSPQLHQRLADRRKARPFGSQHDLRGSEDGRNHRSTHPSTRRWKIAHHAGTPSPGLRTGSGCRQCAVAAKSSRPSLFAEPRGRYQRPSGGPCAAKAASLMTTSPKCAELEKKMGTGRQRTHGSIPHLRPRGGDPHDGGPMRGSIRPCPTVSEADRKRVDRDIAAHHGGGLFPHGL